MYKGIAGSEGIGIGNVVIIEEHEIVIENKKITDTDAEIARLQGAIEKFVDDTNAMADRMEKTVGAKDADILRGHIQMLQDPTIEEQITALIVSEKITAEKALDQVLEQTAEIFAQIPDELLQQRATDFRDIKARILKILLGIEDYDISAAPAGTVLVAHDLTPSMTAGIVAENIAGILTEVGGRTSHSAILARAMEIPAALCMFRSYLLLSVIAVAVCNCLHMSIIIKVVFGNVNVKFYNNMISVPATFRHKPTTAFFVRRSLNTI